MTIINRISVALEKALANLLMILMGAMVIDVLWQVTSRFILNDPSSYTEELARFLLMWVGLIGAAYAFRKHSHLSLDLVINTVSHNKQIILHRIIQVITFWFAAAAMIFGGFKLMLLTLDLHQNSAALGIPMGWIYFCIPLSGMLICWFSFDNFIHVEALVEHHKQQNII